VIITNVIHSAELQHSGNGNFHIMQRVQANITHFEDEYHKLKDATTIFEFALLCKIRMNEDIQEENLIQYKKNRPVD
jgi:hypothetical protein